MEDKPHYHGHRERLRKRFLEVGAASLADYELLELILAAAKPRGDLKPLAKELLKHFKTFGGVIKADPYELTHLPHIGQASVVALKIIQAAAERMMGEEISERPILGAWHHVINYCRLTMGHLKKEQLRLLFLDVHNKLIKDEVQQIGTVDHATVYPREIAERALALGASGLIFIHNHPSGDTRPSQADITMTREIKFLLGKLNIHLHDHLIIGCHGHTSLRAEGFI